MIKLLILTITIIFLTINVQAQSSISKMLKDSSIKIKDPLSLRDPFKREKRISNEGNNGRGQILINNKFSNLPVIESIELDQLRVVGVLLGEKRRAITRIISAEERVLGKETYIIKEGMLLGINKAEVKAIVPGGIVLVEKIRNVYEEDEYIETVIPITTPAKSVNVPR